MKPEICHNQGNRSNQEDTYLSYLMSGVTNSKQAIAFLAEFHTSTLKCTREFDEGSCAISTVYLPKTREVVWSNLGDSQATIFVYRASEQKVESKVLNTLHNPKWPNGERGARVGGELTVNRAYGDKNFIINHSKDFSCNPDYGTFDLNTLDLKPDDRVFLMTSCDGFFEAYKFDEVVINVLRSRCIDLLNKLISDGKYTKDEMVAALEKATNLKNIEFESMNEFIEKATISQHKIGSGIDSVELLLKKLTANLTETLRNREDPQEIQHEIDPFAIYHKTRRRNDLTTKSYEELIAKLLNADKDCITARILKECFQLAKEKSHDNLTALFIDLSNPKLSNEQVAMVAQVFDGHSGDEVSKAIVVNAVQNIIMPNLKKFSQIHSSEYEPIANEPKPEPIADEPKHEPIANEPKHEPIANEPKHTPIPYYKVGGFLLGLGAAGALYASTALPKKVLAATVVGVTLVGAGVDLYINSSAPPERTR